MVGASAAVTEFISACATHMIAALNFRHPKAAAWTLFIFLAPHEVRKKVIRHPIVHAPFLVLLAGGACVIIDPAVQAIPFLASGASKISRVGRGEEKNVRAVRGGTAAERTRIFSNRVAKRIFRVFVQHFLIEHHLHVVFCCLFWASVMRALNRKYSVVDFAPKIATDALTAKIMPAGSHGEGEIDFSFLQTYCAVQSA